MVHALEEIHRLLKPMGTLIDIHPVAEASSIELHQDEKVDLVGSLSVRQWCIDYQEADNALAEIARRGIFAVEREAVFDSLTHYTTVEEMRTEQINAVDKFARDAQSAGEGVLQVEALAAQAEELMRVAGSGAELIIRERVHISRLNRKVSMAQIRDWQSIKTMSARLLQERTGLDVTAWNQRIQAQHFENEQALRDWLSEQGVTSYTQNLLVWEHFGYPDFMQASAEELIQGQYADRPQLRPIFEAILSAVAGLEDVIIQTRKTYVSLRTARRTFARVQPTTKQRVDLALRLEGQKPGGRLQPSRIHETTPLQISLTTLDDVDAEVLDWLQKAYDQNR